MTRWTHDGLAADLMDARHRAGEIAIERLAVAGGVLDVASMRLSWTRPEITGYECKVSRQDFLADVRPGKYRAYLPCVERLYFCLPAALLADISAAEIPEGCGLLVRNDRGWHSLRRPTRRDLDDRRRANFMTALIFRHYPAPWDGATRAHRHVMNRAAAAAS